MSTLCRLVPHAKHILRRFCRCKDVCRTLLTDAYWCNDAWRHRLTSPVLSNVDFSDFIIRVNDKLDKGQSSELDLDILANKLYEMHDSEVEIVEEILEKCRRTKYGVKLSESIKHGIVRGYIDVNLADRFLSLMKDKIKYGLHLDFVLANILMDFFIRKELFHEASQVAYEMMLQEDFSNKITYLLSLYATTKLLYNPVPIQEETQEAGEGEKEEEEIWKAVKVVEFPFYDDHFSIKSEKFLHGKTLYMLGKIYGGAEGRSLQLIGLGMYEKFPRALKLLKEWTSELDKDVVVKDVVSKFEDLLINAPTRDPDEPEKDFGLLRMEDEINKLKLTPLEKEDCIKDWQALKERLEHENKLSSENMEENIYKYVKSEVNKYEQPDIESLTSMIPLWEKERQEELDRQILEFRRQQKQQEIQEKLMEMQEKEELYSYFDNINEIKLAASQAPEPYPEPPEKEEVDEDEDVVSKQKMRFKK